MRKLPPLAQTGIQLLLAVVGLYVIIPIWALLNVSFDGALVGPPLHLQLVPKEFTLERFAAVWTNPYQTMSFPGLMRNSLVVSGGAALIAVAFGLSAAYAFARFRFPGRQAGLFGLLVGTLLPPVALMTPLYILLTLLQIRTTLLGLIVAYTAFSMPFCVWNMRAAFQAVPIEVEEAAVIDGASQFQAFWRIALPLALPSIAVAALLAFLFGYTEFAIAWLFVEREETVTLAMAVLAMTGYAALWGRQAALAVLMGLPVVILFVVLRRYLLSGLLLGTTDRAGD